MSILSHRCVAACLIALLVSNANAQLVYQQKMDRYSAILPLTLNDDVLRVRCKPPQGVTPSEINCDVGVTGTVLTDQRGTSAAEAGEKVVAGLMSRDRIDVQFADRVYSGNRDYVGNRVIDKYNFDCGINIKYQNKNKVAQLELRVGYVLPSGDREGITWQKLATKRRTYINNIKKCDQCEREIENLKNQGQLMQQSVSSNAAQQALLQTKLAGLARQIDRKAAYAARRDEFERDLAAFASLQEYLKTKLVGCQVYVHFHHNGNTLAVDVDELKRSRWRPVQVFQPDKDPIKNGDSIP
jgi:hypothetical protein